MLGIGVLIPPTLAGPPIESDQSCHSLAIIAQTTPPLAHPVDSEGGAAADPLVGSPDHSATMPVTLVGHDGDVRSWGEWTISLDRNAQVLEWVVELTDGRATRTLNQTMRSDGEGVHLWGSLVVAEGTLTRTYTGGWTYTEAGGLVENSASVGGFHREVGNMFGAGRGAGTYYPACCISEESACKTQTGVVPRNSVRAVGTLAGRGRSTTRATRVAIAEQAGCCAILRADPAAAGAFGTASCSGAFCLGDAEIPAGP